MSTFSSARVAKLIVLAAAVILSLQLHAQDTLRVVFTGDILLDRGVRQKIVHLGAHSLFSPSIDTILSRADRVVGNLECPATTIHEPQHKRFVFRAEPEWLQTLHSHGFTHLCLANNHSIDQGRRGLMQTITHISEAEMTPFGAAATMDEAAVPLLLAQHPRPVFLLSSLLMPLEHFAYLPDKPSVSQQSIDSLVAKVIRLKAQHPHACIIVSLHWGAEHTLRPFPSQIEEAHRLIDAGADAIIGHHPHTLQTIETYHGKPIYYSIGNFIFDQEKPLNSRACMVDLTITADNVTQKTIPISIVKCTPTVLYEE